MDDKLIYLSDLEELKGHAEFFSKFGEEYICCQVHSLVNDPEMRGPARFVGMGIVYLKEGILRGELDFKPFELTAPGLISIGRAMSISNTGQVESDSVCECLFMSPKFIRDLNIDLNVINLHDMVENRPEPIVPHLTVEEAAGIEHFIQLMRLNVDSVGDLLFSKNIARSLAQGLFYFLLEVNAQRMSNRTGPKDSPAHGRQIAYVQEFMRLLQIHHKTHRSISFYAGKLFISPKYLSHIIKEATGRSATDWIAEVVSLEAKNMLRYSHKNIQQVAYELNFSTQSSFGKYFKHATGLSPSEFLKG